MYAEVERRAVLYHGFVKTREQDVWLVAEFRDGYHQQTVLLAGVAAHQRGAVICSGKIGAQHFLRE